MNDKKLKIMCKMACEWYNSNIKDVDVFVLWLEKLMQLEEREN